MQIIADWIAAGESGAVVGLRGCGRSNILGFLCNRPDVLRTYLPNQASEVAVIPIDLNDLLEAELSLFYRIVLRSIYRVRHHYHQGIQQAISETYQEYRGERDVFLTQSALQELLLLCQTHDMQVVLVLNHFEHFCEIATTQMVNTLKGLRDGFKDTLSYIVGMPQEVAYLPDAEILGDMYELLDSHVCWVGAMDEDDAKDLINRATQMSAGSPDDSELSTMLTLTGGFPSLLKVTCYWWTGAGIKLCQTHWLDRLIAESSIQHRLMLIWSDLTQEEQFALVEVQRREESIKQVNAQQTLTVSTNGDNSFQSFINQHHDVLTRLAIKGLCYKIKNKWCLASQLLATYIANYKQLGRGKIWLDEGTQEIYQEQTPVAKLTTLEQEVLTFMIRHPRVRHTKTDLIDNTWPDELRQEGVNDNSLYQIILNIRKAIEPNPSKPHYLVTWRGKPEGGYQFFPEGRPG